MSSRSICKEIILLGFFLLFLPAFINAQEKNEQLAEQRMLEQQITESKTIAEKIKMASILATFYYNYKNIRAGDSLLQLMNAWAEKSGKKEDMFSAYRWSAVAYSNSRNLLQKAVTQYQQTIDYTIKERMPNEEILALAALGRVYANLLDYEKAIDCFNRVDLNKEGVHDSTRFHFYYRKATFYIAQQKIVAAFNCLFSAKKYAEKASNSKMIRDAETALAYTYDQVGDYDKAIEWYQATKKEYGTTGDSISVDIGIASIYRKIKNAVAAKELFEKVIIDAERASMPDLKYKAVVGLWGVFYDNNELAKGAETGRKYDMAGYYYRRGDSTGLYNTKAVYAEIAGNLDSADWYYRKTIDFSHQSPVKTSLAFYSFIYGDYLKRYRRYKEALGPMKTALAIYDSLHVIGELPGMNQNLDSIYTALGDYKNAWLARGNYYLYRDSLASQRKKEDILKEEIAVEEERLKKAAEDELKATERKHAIQYRIIILGGILLLTALLTIGFFHSPKWLIKGLTFVSFIFLFEFIILLLDTRLHHLFHGAPLPILAAKVLIACLLVPLHHFTEKKVTHFLQSKKLHRLKTVFKDDPVKT